MSDYDLDSMDPTEMNPMECVFALAEQLGVTNLAKNYAGRLWEHKVDEQWMFAINANRVKVKTTSGVDVDPFHMYVEFNGWPAGVVGPSGEGEFAMGAAANVDTFNAAVIAAAKAARK